MYNYLYITLLKFLIFIIVKNNIFNILKGSKFYRIKFYQLFLPNIYSYIIGLLLLLLLEKELF